MSNTTISVNDWLDRYPEPKSTASRLSADELLQLLKKNDSSTTILDLRNDRAPGFIKQSVHIPATSISGYSDIERVVLDKLLESNKNLKLIVVHCNSSKKRASKVAGWIQDHINEKKVSDYAVTILDKGIVGWLELDEPFSSFVEKVE